MIIICGFRGHEDDPTFFLSPRLDRETETSGKMIGISNKERQKCNEDGKKKPQLKGNG